MTRRILLVLLGFTVVVIVGAGVPLALNASAHDRMSFQEAVAGTARTDAAVAQTRLDYLYSISAATKAGAPKHDTSPSSSTDTSDGIDPPLLTLLTTVRQTGDGLLILKSDHGQLASNAMPPGDWTQLASRADSQSATQNPHGQAGQPVIEHTGSEVVAAVAVYEHGAQESPLVGTVLVARSVVPLNTDIRNLWIILGLIAVIALAAAALLAFALARWVSRPLAGLDAAAGRLADGDLASRARVGGGPPELRRLGTTFNTMAGRLEALVHGNRAVIADVSHQLRTPLAALRLRLDLLAADTDPDTGHELAGALDELARLSRLVDGLLAVARAENVVPTPVAVDVTEVAAERVVAWHPVADDRGITLAAAEAGKVSGWGSRTVVQAWLGEGHLEQMLDNLIANALEALSAGSRISVATMATASGAQIVVSDNGPGMSAEDRERAFLRFTTSSPNGTGLGLAIVHRLVTSNGGTAALTETPGGGLTATLAFPAVPTAQADGGSPACPGGVSGPSAEDFASLSTNL
jgi:signal transduction histidine kinase